MIKESLYFTYAGRRSSDYGILNVNVSTGLFEETFLASSSIVETYVRGREKPYFVEKKREPLILNLTFAFNDSWNNDDNFREIKRWLDIDYYQPLSFSENLDVVYYAIPVNESILSHNGNKQGYFTITFRCDSPYAYSPTTSTAWYRCKDSMSGYFLSPYQFVEDDSVIGTIIDFPNTGDGDIFPELFIKKQSDGDLSIINLSYYNSEFKFTDLKTDEELYVHCENEIITTSLPNTWRYDNFNDNYLAIGRGKNRLQIVGDCEIMFRYCLKFK